MILKLKVGKETPVVEYIKAPFYQVQEKKFRKYCTQDSSLIHFTNVKGFIAEYTSNCIITIDLPRRSLKAVLLHN